MCFYIDRQMCPKAKIATKPIIAYKIVAPGHSSKEYISIWLDFLYIRNNFYFSKIKKGIGSYYGIEHGLHTFRQRPSNPFRDEKVVRFTIPKGAQYYENESEYVSNCLWVGTKPPNMTSEQKKELKRVTKLPRKIIKEKLGKFKKNHVNLQKA